MYMDYLKKKYLNEIKKESKTEKKHSQNTMLVQGAKIMQYIDAIGGSEINETLKIVEKKDYDDQYGLTQGTHYSVYKDHVLVFSGYISNDIHTTLYKYIQGQWEQEIRDYLTCLIEKTQQESNKKLSLIK